MEVSTASVTRVDNLKLAVLFVAGFALRVDVEIDIADDRCTHRMRARAKGLRELSDLEACVAVAFELELLLLVIGSGLSSIIGVAAMARWGEFWGAIWGGDANSVGRVLVGAFDFD